MIKHSAIWAAIDKVANQAGLSPSGLAKKAGLDPTSFNKSKRTAADGKERWPTMESIAKILHATGVALGDFMALVDDKGGRRKSLPLLGAAQAGREGYFDDAGYPSGNGWEEIDFPGIADTGSYALKVSGDSMEPLYRDGDILVVARNAKLRRGDRVVVKTRNGEVMAKQLERFTNQRIELKSLNPLHRDIELTADDVAWIARVVWVSQ